MAYKFLVSGLTCAKPDSCKNSTQAKPNSSKTWLVRTWLVAKPDSLQNLTRVNLTQANQAHHGLKTKKWQRYAWYWIYQEAKKQDAIVKCPVRIFVFKVNEMKSQQVIFLTEEQISNLPKAATFGMLPYWLTKLGYLPESVGTVEELCERQDDILFTKILSDPHHILAHHLRPAKHRGFSLQPRPHSFAQQG